MVCASCCFFSLVALTCCMFSSRNENGWTRLSTKVLKQEEIAAKYGNDSTDLALLSYEDADNVMSNFLTNWNRDRFRRNTLPGFDGTCYIKRDRTFLCKQAIGVLEGRVGRAGVLEMCKQCGCDYDGFSISFAGSLEDSAFDMDEYSNDLLEDLDEDDDMYLIDEPSQDGLVGDVLQDAAAERFALARIAKKRAAKESDETSLSSLSSSGSDSSDMMVLSDDSDDEDDVGSGVAPEDSSAVRFAAARVEKKKALKQLRAVNHSERELGSGGSVSSAEIAVMDFGGDDHASLASIPGSISAGKKTSSEDDGGLSNESEGSLGAVVGTANAAGVANGIVQPLLVLPTFAEKESTNGREVTDSEGRSNDSPDGGKAHVKGLGCFRSIDEKNAVLEVLGPIVDDFGERFFAKHGAHPSETDIEDFWSAMLNEAVERANAARIPAEVITRNVL